MWNGPVAEAVDRQAQTSAQNRQNVDGISAIDVKISVVRDETSDINCFPESQNHIDYIADKVFRDVCYQSSCCILKMHCDH